MSLHAKVFCNCYETGNVRTPPPDSDGIAIAPDGDLYYKNKDFAKVLDFDRWRRDAACEHKDGILVLNCLGNIALVGLLRDELGREPNVFPVLFNKVVYNGVHAGDYLAVEDVLLLKDELKSLRNFNATDSRSQLFLNAFVEQMDELATTALSVRKPIVF